MTGASWRTNLTRRRRHHDGGSQMEVALAVASGVADAGLGVRATAIASRSPCGVRGPKLARPETLPAQAGG
jgi:hypothetical protein